MPNLDETLEDPAARDPFHVRQVTRKDVRLTYCRSSGKGGQHVNKTESKVQVYFNPSEATWLPHAVRAKFIELHSKKLSAKGEYIIMAQDTRHQPENLEIALSRLQQLLEAAADEARPPPPLTDKEEFEIEKRRALAEYANEKRLERKKYTKMKKDKVRG